MASRKKARTSTVAASPYKTAVLPALRVRRGGSPLARVTDWLGGIRHEIWLDALYVWIATRTLFLALTYLVPALLGPVGTAQPVGILGPLRSWVTQDGAHLAYIAQHGYDQPWRTAFFPLFPLAEHLLAPIVGGDYGLAGMLISNVAYLGALVVLRDLVARDFDPDVARRALLYLSIFPTAFYFFAPYSESLYLVLSLGAFSALRRRRWWVAGALGGLAVLTRSTALALLLPFAIEFIAARRYGLVRGWHALWALLIPAGVGIYALYLARMLHDPLAFSHAQAYWTRSLQWPWQGIVEGIGALGTAGQHGTVALAHLALNLAATLVFLGLTVLVVRRLPPSYGLYTAALLLYFLLFPPQYAAIAMQSSGRFVAVLFPVFILLARWGRRPRVHELLLLGQVALLTLLTIHFLSAPLWGNTKLWWS
ncbi:MAG: hypothetical protein PVSMB4_11420 [Ktedonobacterales bacterium]